ncbi:unnamed protein product [Cercospora beticola]|nr:unnamed protein product [Cercospora beticola]
MAQPPSSGNPVMIRPEQIDQLPFLDAPSKLQYKQGLTQIWNQFNNSPEGSDQRKEAETKIRTASSRLMAQLANRNRPNSAQGQPGQQNQQPRPAQQGGQPQQMSQQQQGQQPGQQAGQMTQQQMAQAQAAARARQQGQGGQGGNAMGNQQQLPQLMPKSQEDLDNVVLTIPAEQQQAWRNQAHSILAKRDQILNQARSVQSQLSRYQQSQQPVPENMRKNFEAAKQAVATVNQNWNNWKARGEGRADGAQQARPATQQGAVNATSQQQQPDAKPTNGLPSPPQPQAGFQQNQQGASQNQQNAQPPQAANQQQMAQSSDQPQQQPQQQQNFPQQNNMGSQMQQQRPPQINTSIPNQAATGQQSGAPQTAMPNSAGQNGRQPQPLTHQAAMASAAESYHRENQPQQQGPQAPQMPNGLPFSTQPNNTSQQNTPTYPNLQTTQQSSANTKFPIPKTLQLGPQTQQPVPGPPARPTYNNAGMMQQPGIQRPPPFTLEGEGDRVLSKRKLDELVRQVTGAAPAASDSESSNVLSPEVEEVMLELADDFTDSVLGDACKLAKMRPNQTLDIRDIQIVLERKYGIRIPGYSLEEARTVKKFQPAAAWQNKMQAVQAAKVMGGRDP